MIELKNLSKHYRLESTIVKAVDKVNLKVEKGEFAIIIGRSGCGKTTLLSLIDGLTKPTSGKVNVNGGNIWKMSDRDRSQLRAKIIGFIFQFPSLIPTLTTLDNVMLPALFDKTNSDVYNRSVKLLKDLRLGDRLNAYPSQLSIGQQKRVATARALANKPEILLADEPTSDLDIKTEKEVMLFLLKAIREENLTVLMVTHHVGLAKYASRIFTMSNGILNEANKDGEIMNQ